MPSRSWKILPAVILSAAALAGCQTTEAAAPAAPEPDASTARRDLTAPEKQLLAAAFTKDLKDPGSAQIKWAKIPVPNGPATLVRYCATLNAKNSYGGYVGQKPFIAIVTYDGQKIRSAAIELLASDDFSVTYVTGLCAKHNLDPFSAV